DGSPLAGVQARLYRPMVDMHTRIFGGRSQVVILRDAGVKTSDDEGRFHFAHVPREGASVSVRADGIVPRSVPIRAQSFDGAVEMRCHLEVVVRQGIERFDAISVLDGEGKGLDILVLTEGSTNAWTGVALVQGRSGVVSVSSRARTLQLMKNGAVVETRALDL